MSRLIQDPNSLEWVQVRQFIEARLAECRTDNDEDLNEVDTAHLRGVIAFAKEILELDQDDPATPEGDIPDLHYVE